MARYSLWLLLSRQAHERFRALIASLSVRLGTPVFEPHITLLGGLTGSEETLRQESRTLAAMIEPFEVQLLQAGGLDEYYRCLFVEVAALPTLHAVREVARQVFDQRAEAVFEPRLSLVYGNLDPEEKENIFDTIGRFFDESIRIEELALYENNGPLISWRCVERGQLGAGRQVDVHKP